jgi:hypothetical protein
MRPTLIPKVCKKAGCIKMASGNFAVVVPVDETFEMFRGLLIPFHSDVVNEYVGLMVRCPVAPFGENCSSGLLFCSCTSVRKLPLSVIAGNGNSKTIVKVGRDNHCLMILVLESQNGVPSSHLIRDIGSALKSGD